MFPEDAKNVFTNMAENKFSEKLIHTNRTNVPTTTNEDQKEGGEDESENAPDK